MRTSIPVWQTLSDAFSFILNESALFAKALILPVLIFISLQALGLFVAHPDSPIHWLISFANLILFAWMMNVCCRLVITHDPGHRGWTSAETWSAVWLLCLNFVMSLMAGLPAFAVFTVMLMIAPLFALPVALCVFFLLDVYLCARFVLVFPATAMGDKTSFRDAWEMSDGNGWRLVLLFALVPFLYGLAAFLLFLLLPVPIFLALLFILGTFFALVGVVAVAMAYKKLRGGL